MSILNNDDNPSFAVRSAPRLPRHQGSLSHPYPSELEPPPALNHRRAYPDLTTMRRPRDPTTESDHPTSPGSSDGSHDYMPGLSTSSYPQYARQEPYGYPRARERPLSMTLPVEPPSPQTMGGGPDAAIPQAGSRKNKYPCPYAASHGCAATFTTSGHAARHGKKHTGEKSVHCPICNKAFTRKDNMKQHIRTHRTHSEDTQAGDATGWAPPHPAYHHSRSISQTQMPVAGGYQRMTGMDPTTQREHGQFF